MNGPVYLEGVAGVARPQEAGPGVVKPPKRDG